MTKIDMKSLKIGKIEIDNPIISAPLAGVSDKAYRRVLKENGVPLVFTEMVSAKALIYENEKSRKIVDISGEEKPIGMQLFGNNIKEITESAKYLESIGADIIDFNIGCPAPKIVKNFEGSALLKEPEKAISILEGLVKSVDVPVTLKIRKGFSEGNHDAMPIIKGAEKVGVEAIFIHGRDREQYYSGKADWDYIKMVKENVSIPVIGNGDVNDPYSAEKMLIETGCDGILIGRGFLGNPFLFKEIMEYFNTGKFTLASNEEKLMMAIRQLDYTIEDKGEIIAVREMRKHFGWYLKGIKNGSYYRNIINSCTQVDVLKDLIKTVLEG
ncbi:MAG: nifR3 family TIM-barrel protein [Fusobacteria bacterium]|nr:MAG: nifR3 family TIM-barrel protein [Fusobacteriota bacterium]KAF0227930.1 MAG: nifR3 family TIM-barrel [Fusobacteriota bacterium]